MSRRLRRRVGLRRSKPAIGSKRRSKPTIGSKRWRKKRRFRAPDNECYICYDEFDHTKCEPYGCGHYFHADCIDRWRNSGNTANHSRCPYCRKSTTNTIRKPQTYEQVLQAIYLLPPSVTVVYVDMPPPIEVNSHVALELMSSLMPTRAQQEAVAEAILNKQTIQSIKGREHSVLVHLVWRMINISCYETDRFFRSFALVQARRLHADNTLKHMTLTQFANDLGSEWWFWNDFVELAGRHAGSVERLHVYNRSSIDSSNFDMSNIPPMPNLLFLTLEGVNFESMSLEGYSNLTSLKMFNYNYAENASCSFLCRLKELDSVREIELFECRGWEGGHGKKVLIFILAALRENSTLRISASPSLFCSNDANLAADFFSALLLRRITKVVLTFNFIEIQFYQWKKSLSDENFNANEPIFSKWVVS